MATAPIPASPPGEAPSVIQSTRNAVLFDPKSVVPSQPIYLQRNDQLIFYSYTTVAGAQLRVNYRYLTPEGEIKEGTFISLPWTGFALVGFPIYEGWLLSFQVAQITMPAAGTWTFTQASIGRSATPALGVPSQGNLWQGFVLNAASNGWPGTASKEITDGAGTIRSITGSTPAAGADINEVVPTNHRWTLLSFTAVLTTGVAVANRNATVLLDDGTNVYFASPSFLNQVASIAQRYTLAQQPTTNAPLAGPIVLETPLPLPMKAGFRIHTSTSNLQAADQWSAPQYTILEWGLWDA